MPVTACSRSCSNSSSGKVGSRSTPASNASASASLSRRVSSDRPAPCNSPPTPPLACSASSFWSICTRLSAFEPRISMAPVKPAAMSRPVSEVASPKRKLPVTVTVPPRVRLGSRATFRPSPTVMRWVRASMLAGLGSKFSPASTAARPA